jgi:hypothetical protein
MEADTEFAELFDRYERDIAGLSRENSRLREENVDALMAAAAGDGQGGAHVAGQAQATTLRPSNSENWDGDSMHTGMTAAGGQGRAVHVDPIKPTSEAPEIKRSILKYFQLLSSFAFIFNLRRYIWGRARGGTR